MDSACSEAWWDRVFTHSLRHTTQQQKEKQGLACPGFAAYVEIKHSLLGILRQQKGKAEKGLPGLRRPWQAPEQVQLALDGSERVQVSTSADLTQYKLVQST